METPETSKPAEINEDSVNRDELILQQQRDIEKEVNFLIS
jgi:hypothetical protein